MAHTAAHLNAVSFWWWQCNEYVLDIKIPDPPTFASLISLSGFCKRKATCFLLRQADDWKAILRYDKNTFENPACVTTRRPSILASISYSREIFEWFDKDHTHTRVTFARPVIRPSQAYQTQPARYYWNVCCWSFGISLSTCNCLARYHDLLKRWAALNQESDVIRDKNPCNCHTLHNAYTCMYDNVMWMHADQTYTEN